MYCMYFCTTKGLENRVYSSGFYWRYTWVLFPFLNQRTNVYAKDVEEIGGDGVLYLFQQILHVIPQNINVVAYN